jgi:hypothetical protein
MSSHQAKERNKPMTENENPLAVGNATGCEREAAGTEEANQLRAAIYNALYAYADYLDRYGLIWDLTKIDGSDPLKAERLIAEMDFRSTDERVGPTFNIILKGGALDPQPHDVSIPIYRRC